MINPNELTGKTVLEKLKYWHNEGEITLIRNRNLNRSYDVPILVSGIKFTEDMKWCMGELKRLSTLCTTFDCYGLLAKDLDPSNDYRDKLESNQIGLHEKDQEPVK